MIICESKGYNHYFCNKNACIIADNRVMDKNNHLVIMAGGVGSRFWPMSTPECPKQFIDVLGVGKTLLQLTADRFRGAVPMSNIWVVTSVSYFDKVRAQLPFVPVDQILLEPCMRNTAPCLAYVSWKIYQKFPEANIVVSPADHIVIDTAEFLSVVKKGLEFVRTDSNILTLGMMPTRPETGYGYIKSSEKFFGRPIKIEQFREKPDIETARTYLREGNYYWNAGIFFWNVLTVIDELRLNAPDITEIFDRLSPYLYTDEEQKMVNELFPQCRSISVDYAVMEKAKNAYVLPASFGWSDLGTWGSLHQQLQHDEMNNAYVGGEVKLVESEDCIVRMPEGKKVVIQGLKGYIIAENENRLLICRLEDEQRIKEFSK